MTERTEALPLAGIRVVEFVHMVMGPTCGLVLGDLGAEVIKVEPVPDGDNTRRLSGMGAGFWPAFNRNKKSLAVDMKSAEGVEIVRRLVATADVVTENFRPGALDALGFGYEALRALKPNIIYVSMKGFLSGPYEDRTALDEVVQMMGGLAYMTGLPGHPMRVGSSVNDIMGGMFGAIGAIAALHERSATGRGRLVKSGLFENCAFLVGQHMMQLAVTGQSPQPMSVRNPAWGVYDIFDTAASQKLFIAVVTDTQWREFCQAFELSELGGDTTLATNAQRVASRERTLPAIQRRLGSMPAAEVVSCCQRCGVSWGPINRPADLFDDPHLNAPGGMVQITLADGSTTAVPALPIEFDGLRPATRLDLPALGEHTDELLRELGYPASQIEALRVAGWVRTAES